MTVRPVARAVACHASEEWPREVQISSQSIDADAQGATNSWQLLATDRRFAWFMAGLAPGAIVIGIFGVTRALTATEVFGDETGIGTTAAFAALAGACAGLVSGPVLDRWNARWILITAMVLFGLSQLVTFSTYTTGSLTPSLLTVISIVDGFLVGMQITALLTTQAGLVTQANRGVAEITNALRIGLGSLLGTLLATSVLTLQTALLLSGIVVLLVTAATVWTTRGFVPAHAVHRATFSDAWTIFTSDRPLRSALIIGALLALVLPTQLVNLVIVDMDMPQMVGLAAMAGVVGVLGARFHLSLTGLRGSLTARVLRSYVAFTVAIAISWVVIVADSRTLILVSLVPLILVGSWSSSLAFGLVAATVQQRLPDAVRGRFTGASGFVLGLAVAGGVMAATVVITPQDTKTLLPLMLASLIVVLVITRGFRGLAAAQVTSSG